jgi:hypothetical protein
LKKIHSYHHPTVKSEASEPKAPVGQALMRTFLFFAFFLAFRANRLS